MNHEMSLVARFELVELYLERIADARRRALDGLEPVVPDEAGYAYIRKQVGVIVDTADKALELLDGLRLPLLDHWRDADARRAETGKRN